MYASVYIISSLLTLSLGVFGSQVFPSSFSFPTAAEVNGSSANGCCSNFTTANGLTTCKQPNTSVLFDGIPTLTGLDGDMWASQLLVLLKPASSVSVLTFDLDGIINKVEVVMYNCASHGLSIGIDGRHGQGLPHTVTVSSCTNLVRICLSPVSALIEGGFTLIFYLPPEIRMIYLAEVRFYANDFTCQPDTIVTAPPPPPPDTTTPPPDTTTPPPPGTTTMLPPPDTTILVEMIIASSPSNVVPSTSSEPCPSCSTSTVLASVITAIATALLATVIFVLVQIAVCKCHPKFTPGGAETGASAGGEGKEYEQVSDPTYMEVGARGRTFQLEENEAYTAHGGENDFGLRKNEAYATLN